MPPVAKHLSPAPGEGTAAATAGRRLHTALLLSTPPTTGTSTDEEATSVAEQGQPP
jgi:hypothetical protein